MATAAQIINRATSLIGARAVGQTLEPAIVGECFDILRVMLDGMASDPGLFNTETLTLPVVAGQSVYVLPTRPYNLPAGFDADKFPLELIPLDTMSLQTTSQGTPSAYAYDGAGTLTLYPIPDANTTLTFRVPGGAPVFPSVAASVDLADGVENMLAYALAVEIAPAFAMQVPQSVMMGASVAKRGLRARNFVRVPVDCPVGAGREFDIIRGY